MTLASSVARLKRRLPPGGWRELLPPRFPDLAQSAAHRGFFAWTLLAIAVSTVLLPRANELFVLLAALLILAAGIVFGSVTFWRASAAIERERGYCLAVIDVIDRLLRPAVNGTIDSERRQLPTLRATLRSEMRARQRPDRPCEAEKLAEEVFTEAECHRFASAAGLVDGVEAARPELLRSLRLVQVQALRAGILGTFIGLLFGLEHVGDASNIRDMLEGMRTGFATSIAGLIVACWAGFVAHGLTGRQRTLRGNLHAMLADLLGVVSRATQTGEYFRELQQAASSMDKLKDQIGQRLADVSGRLDGAAMAMAQGPALWDRIATALDRHSTAVADIEKAMQHSSSAATQAYEDCTRHVQQAVEQMRGAYAADTLRRVEDTSISKLETLGAELRAGLTSLHHVVSPPLTEGTTRLAALEANLVSARRTLLRAAWALGILVFLLLTTVAGGIAWLVHLSGATG